MHPSSLPETPELSELSPLPRFDWGRLIAVPLSGAMLALNIGSIISWPWGEQSGLDTALGFIARVAVCAFWVLVVAAYLRRRPAIATSASPAAYAAALAASFLPFAFPLLGYRATNRTVVALADLLLTAGTGFTVWGIRHLDRSFSIVPQARAVVSSGPYRVVRHPLYAGELAAALGLALLVGTAWAFIVWLALVALQLYRTRHEERVLTAHLTGYAAYAAQTGLLIPGVGKRKG